MMPDKCDELRGKRWLSIPATLAPFRAFFPRIGQIIFATARKRINVPAPWGRCVSAPVDTSGRQCATMNGFGENSGNLLRQGAMLGRRATTERLFQFIGNVSTDEHSFTIDHCFRGLLVKINSTVDEGRFRLPAG